MEKAVVPIARRLPENKKTVKTDDERTDQLTRNHTKTWEGDNRPERGKGREDCAMCEWTHDSYSVSANPQHNPQRGAICPRGTLSRGPCQMKPSETKKVRDALSLARDTRL